ncbi:MAG TPA: hypothetical protein VF426_02600 [Marmoricola sp.]
MNDSDTIERTRQPVKVAHLVLGSFFLGVTALWALTESGTLTWKGSSYLVPLTLLIAGAIGLTASLVGNTADRRRSATYEPSSVATSPADVSEQPHDDTRMLPTDQTDAEEER